MNDASLDVIFAGGGVAATLAAIRLKEIRPKLALAVLDAGDRAKESQTLSFQAIPGGEEALADPATSWLAPWISTSWPRYEVRFPELKRTVEAPYFSIRSADFFPKARGYLGGAYRTRHAVRHVGDGGVTLADGRVLEARIVIDARGMVSDERICAYQKFVGLTVETEFAHKLTHPLLMDALVEQVDGFRFFYVLPWSDHELLVEDTRYSDDPMIDEDAYKEEILGYLTRRGWYVKRIQAKERGVLPIPFHGAKRPDAADGVGLGVRVGLFHPTTGYSIYEAIRAADLLARIDPLTPEAVTRGLRDLAVRRWREQEFYRRLNNMMFFAAHPRERYRVLQHFYRRDAPLLARFYGGVTTPADKLQILSGKPPVPIRKGLYHFFHKREVSHGDI